MGCVERFAKDTGQELTDFYSIDKRSKNIDPASGEKKKKQLQQNIHQMNSNLKNNMKFGS